MNKILLVVVSLVISLSCFTIPAYSWNDRNLEYDSSFPDANQDPYYQQDNSVDEYRYDPHYYQDDDFGNDTKYRYDPYKRKQRYLNESEKRDRDFQNKVYVTRVKMIPEYDSILLDYFEWIRIDAPVDEKIIGYEFDTNYNYYYNCVINVMAYNFVIDQDTTDTYLDEWDYYPYIRGNLLAVIDICRDMK
jgi:uncharacterized protein YxeA